jgi:hypothetical protein
MRNIFRRLRPMPDLEFVDREIVERATRFASFAALIPPFCPAGPFPITIRS